MKKVCSKDPSHDLFITSAVICQDWLVDSEGNFVDIVLECTEIFHKPSPDNIWQCAVCGAEATNPELKLVVDN
tara:strand:- start:340 stop:558 length:219 start_codon:yes stop_codon:yes gene_type:complete